MERNIELNRRKVLGTVGGLAVAGSGMAFFSSGNAAATNVHISASDPDTVKDDRGELEQVTVDPTVEINWHDMDEAVGKIFVLVEASVDGGDFYPIFRMTPWLTEETDGVSGVSASQPGTTGHYHLNNPLSNLLGRALIVADREGRPDYKSLSFSGGVDYESFIDGYSVGSASDYEDEGHQNNFPDDDAGYYGAAEDASVFDQATDSEMNETGVELRYTFALHTVNQSMVDATGGSVGSGHYSDVQEVVEDSQGNSQLVMNGEDGYPDITENGASSPASTDYDAYRSVADSHPAVVTTTASFTVTVLNEQANTGATGDSGTGAN